MLDRYFVQQPIEGEVARLVDEEAHHLAHVMRARPGDDVVIFDGSGAEWQARVARVSRSAVELQVLERRNVDRELAIDVTLAVALPKSERQRWLVEKATELGVRRLEPLVTERGVAQPVEKALVRLRRTVIEASKQCGRNRLMEIAMPLKAVDFFATPGADTLRAIADPSGRQSLRSLLESHSSAATRALCFAVGPEGGFSENEIVIAGSKGWTAVTLGPRILRIETAAIHVAAVAASYGPS
ncbi:MAG: 16S rRNA (uracil(1498)-N(3))-methyltransferase [Pirellulales bacterium]